MMRTDVVGGRVAGKSLDARKQRVTDTFQKSSLPYRRIRRATSARAVPSTIRSLLLHRVTMLKVV